MLLQVFQCQRRDFSHSYGVIPSSLLFQLFFIAWIPTHFYLISFKYNYIVYFFHRYTCVMIKVNAILEYLDLAAKSLVKPT